MLLEKKETWFNQKQMAESIGISARAFQDWRVEPIAKIGRQAFYDVQSVLDNRLNHALDKAPLDGSELEQERLRLTKAQADNLEIKNEQLRGNVCPIEFIALVLSKVSGEAAGILDSIPLDIKRKHPELPNQTIENIKRHIVKAQNAVSRVDEILEQVIDDHLKEIDS